MKLTWRAGYGGDRHLYAGYRYIGTMHFLKGARATWMPKTTYKPVTLEAESMDEAKAIVKAMVMLEG